VTLTVVAAVLAKCVNAARTHNVIFPPSDEVEEVGAKTLMKIEPSSGTAAAAVAAAKAAATRAKAFKKRPTSTGGAWQLMLTTSSNAVNRRFLSQLATYDGASIARMTWRPVLPTSSNAVYFRFISKLATFDEASITPVTWRAFYAWP